LQVATSLLGNTLIRPVDVLGYLLLPHTPTGTKDGDGIGVAEAIEDGGSSDDAEEDGTPEIAELDGIMTESLDDGDDVDDTTEEELSGNTEGDGVKAAGSTGGGTAVDDATDGTSELEGYTAGVILVDV
jgi:hypothetical protein